MSVNQSDTVQKKSYLICILQMKILFAFELRSSLLCFLLLLLISHTERLSSFWSLEHFKYLIIGFFFNKRERREKLLEQWKKNHREQWLYYNMSESSWIGGGLGNISFRTKKTYIYLSKFVESCRKLSQELQSYYGCGSSIFTLWSLEKVKKKILF